MSLHCLGLTNHVKEILAPSVEVSAVTLSFSETADPTIAGHFYRAASSARASRLICKSPREADHLQDFHDAREERWYGTTCNLDVHDYNSPFRAFQAVRLTWFVIGGG